MRESFPSPDFTCLENELSMLQMLPIHAQLPGTRVMISRSSCNCVCTHSYVVVHLCQSNWVTLTCLPSNPAPSQCSVCSCSSRQVASLNTALTFPNYHSPYPLQEASVEVSKACSAGYHKILCIVNNTTSATHEHHPRLLIQITT